MSSITTILRFKKKSELIKYFSAYMNLLAVLGRKKLRNTKADNFLNFSAYMNLLAMLGRNCKKMRLVL
jgi:hypothetical protein